MWHKASGAELDIWLERPRKWRQESQRPWGVSPARSAQSRGGRMRCGSWWSGMKDRQIGTKPPH